MSGKEGVFIVRQELFLKGEFAQEDVEPINFISIEYVSVLEDLKEKAMSVLNKMNVDQTKVVSEENVFVIVDMLFGNSHAENAQTMLNQLLIDQLVYVLQILLTTLNKIHASVDAIFLKVGLMTDVSARVDLFHGNKFVENALQEAIQMMLKLHVFVQIVRRSISLIQTHAGIVPVVS